MKLPPQLTHAEKLARTQAKRLAVCRWLAGGEVYSTVPVLAALLGLHPSGVGRLLSSMAADKLLVQEKLTPTLTIWGITPHGLAFADAAGDPHHELSRTNPAYVQHRLDRQLMRLQAERAGWTAWTNERQLHIDAERSGIKLRKIPDAIATAPDGRRVAIEIERFAKSPKRYAELILAYVLEIKAGRYAAVHFVCPPGIARLVERAMSKVDSIKHHGEAVKIEDSHRRRFSYYDFAAWPPSASAGTDERQAA